MSSKVNSAEQNFEDAFERLKAGRPRILPIGTPVSQNNVAKEAGTDPSAFRKSRYPALIRKVQAVVEIENQAVIHRKTRQQRTVRARDSLSAKVKILEQQRDFAQSELVSAQRLILDLLQERAILQAELGQTSAQTVPLHR